ncbi:DEAD/DEAH box helicase [Helicobacter japonicus]|uniref:DEAD/DEAH box helicase n=1 Tax=Helicobacter japonicus TaxID=425400 RepID=UPI0023F12602|nr:DEAD/DEAH box helicase family protein [Helicobacter japonicus]
MIQAVKDLQNEAVKRLVGLLPHKKEITFKAPTGSGKTYMMSDLMNRVLSQDKDIIFIVSTLSKGNLAEQNFKAFMQFTKEFKNLKPFLISSESSGENALDIPLDFNVYVLARDLYKKKSKLKQGAFAHFLYAQKGLSADLSHLGQKEIKKAKKIYLIKDECHIATSNLDELILDSKGKGYFEKVINLSATPKLSRGQYPDVQISETEAVSAKLIKKAKFIEEDSIQFLQVLEKFKEVREAYKESQIGINPCLIVQISNKDKAEAEIKELKATLNREGFKDLKWLLIVEKDKDCDTNDFFRAKNLPVKRWKDYAKENTSSIDIIIFKMVISEGWDIPRACMLYQIRDSKSKQLDEQVIGRVRRNPCLLEFESLSPSVQELVSTAYIYGIKPKDEGSISVRLKGEISSGLLENEVQKEFKIHTTRLKRVGEKLEFKPDEMIKAQSENIVPESIFELYERLAKNTLLAKECEKYVRESSNGEKLNEGVQRWFSFAYAFESLKKAYNGLVGADNYEQTMEIENAQDSGLLSLQSVFSVSEFTSGDLKKWIWQKESEKAFCFDSLAERKWLEVLMDFSDIEVNDKRLVKDIRINDEKIYLLGKNFPYGSSVRFEYYLEGYHFSYPDFILKDWADRIHIFEVKSVNKSKNFSGDRTEYNNKIFALKQCYKAASRLLAKECEKANSKESAIRGYCFYLPILKDDKWHIECFENGENTLYGIEDLQEKIKKFS